MVIGNLLLVLSYTLVIFFFEYIFFWIYFSYPYTAIYFLEM